MHGMELFPFDLSSPLVFGVGEGHRNVLMNPLILFAIRSSITLMKLFSTFRQKYIHWIRLRDLNNFSSLPLNPSWDLMFSLTGWILCPARYRKGTLILHQGPSVYEKAGSYFNIIPVIKVRQCCDYLSLSWECLCLSDFRLLLYIDVVPPPPPPPPADDLP